MTGPKEKSSVPALCGCLAKQRLACGPGAIHRAGSQGLYLRFSDLVLLCDRRFGQIPFGIYVADYGLLFDSPKPQVGSPVVFDGKHLVFPWGLSLTIEEKSLPSCCAIPCGWEHHARRALQQSGKGAVCSLALGGEKSLWARQAEGPVHGLMHAIRAEDGTALFRCLEHLIGLGPGLTPSMDDWLLGLLYYWEHNRVKMFEGSLYLLRQGLRKLSPGRTTDISAAFLTAAAEGYAFEILDRALAGNFAADTDGILCVGSSSGADILTGMVCAAELLNISSGAEPPLNI